MSRWGDEKTLRFIDLYREQECLWNTRSPLYKNKQARECAYRSILTTFNDIHLDLKSVKTKIKNLRSVYHTELKKVRDTMRYGSDGQVYKPSLSWFDEMHAFLGDSIEDRGETAGGTITIKVESIRSSPKDDTELKQNTVAEDEQITFEPPFEPQQNHQITLDAKATHTNIGANDTNNLQTSTPTNVRMGNRRKRSHESVFSTLNRLENTVSNILNTMQQQSTSREDEFHMFGLSVAAQLRQLPLHIAIATQSKIQGILSEARIASIFSNSLSQPSLKVKKEDEIDD